MRLRRTLANVASLLLSFAALGPLAAQQAATVPCRVTGTVRNQSQQPVVSAVVQLTAGNGQRFPFSTDTAGRYCARGLAPGSYIVTASKLMLAMDKPANGAPPTVTVTNAPAPVTFDIAMHLASQMVESLHGPAINGAAGASIHPPPVALPPQPVTALPLPVEPVTETPTEHRDAPPSTGTPG